MENLFQVDILSPDKIICSQEAASLNVPVGLGYIGILANHAPLIACLSKGKIVVKSQGEEKVFQSPGKGFVEVLKNKVTILFD